MVPVIDLQISSLSKVGKKNKEVLNCEGCMSVRYCSAKCQLEVWKDHKTKCKQMNEKRLNARKTAPDSIVEKPDVKTDLCASCGTSEANSSCSVCKVTRYCSRECQTSHWKEHKPVCKKK